MFLIKRCILLCGNKEDLNTPATNSSPEDSEDELVEEDDFKRKDGLILPYLLTYSIPRREPRVYGGLMTTNRNGDINNDHWSKPKGSNNMEYIMCKGAIDLDVSGSIPMTKLHPNKTYKGVFEVKLTNDASGWDGNRVTVEVSGPGGIFLSSMHNVLDQKSLITAPFTTPDQLTGDLIFRLYQKSKVVKKGLIIKRFILRTT